MGTLCTLPYSKKDLSTKKFLFSLLFTLLFKLGTSSTFYWVGSISSSWNEGQNWSLTSGGESCTMVPTMVDTVIFDGRSNRWCEINTSVEVSSLSLEGSFTDSIIQGNNVLSAANIIISGGTFIGGMATINSTNFKLTAGKFKSTQGTFNISGSYTIEGGEFLHNRGIVSFGKSSYISGSHVLYHLTFTNITANDAIFSFANHTELTVEGDLIINGNRSIVLNNGKINAHGNISMQNTSEYYWAGNATIIINGTENQILDGRSNFTGNFPNISIQKNSGILFLKGSIPVAGNWEHISGNVDAAYYQSSIYFASSCKVAGNQTFYNLLFTSGPSNPCTFDLNGNELTVTGEFSIGGNSSVILDNGKINAHGNISMKNTGEYYWAGNATIAINGSTDQILDGKTNFSGNFPNISIEKNSGILFLKGNIPVAGNWDYISGTIDALSHQSTLYFSVSNRISGNQTFYNLFFTSGPSNPTTFDLYENEYTVFGKFKINGNSSVALNNGKINALGDLVIGNKARYSWAGNASIYINGTGDQLLESVYDYTGNLPSIIIEKNSGTFFLKGVVPIAGTWEYRSGNLDAITYQSTLYFNVSTTIIGNQTLYNVTFANNPTLPNPQSFELANGTVLTTEGTISINGDRAISIDSGTIHAHGDIVMNNTAFYSSAGDGIIYINGTRNQIIDGRTNYTGNFPSLSIEKNSGTLFLKGIVPVAGTWEYKYGNLDALSYASTLYFSTSTTIIGSHTLYNLRFSNLDPSPQSFEISSGTEITTEGLLHIEGDRSISINTGKINVHGNIRMNNSAISISGGSGTFEINGNQDQYIYGKSSISGCFPNITINKNSGIVYFNDIIVSGGNWKYISGNVDAVTNNSTVYMNGPYTIIGENNGQKMSFNHLVINQSEITLAGNAYVKGNFFIEPQSIFDLSSHKLFLSGNWENNGTFKHGSGEVVFNGDLYQSLYSHNPFEAFYNFKIDKAGGELALLSPVQINNRLTFSKGIINTDTIYSITFLNGAVAEGGSKESFISGPVIKYGNDSFTFPLGKGTSYQPLFISAPANLNDVIMAEYINELIEFPNAMDSSMDKRSECEYWYVNSISGAPSVLVGLGWASHNGCGNLTSLTIEDTSMVTIARLNGNNWENIGNSRVDGNVENGIVYSSLKTSPENYYTLAKKTQTFTNPCDTTHFNTISIQSTRNCSSSGYTYNFSTIGNNYAEYTYEWNFGNDASSPYSSSSAPSGITFSSTGSHTIYLTIHSNTCDSTLTYSFDVISKPNFGSIRVESTESCSAQGYFYNFSTSVPVPASYSLEWNFGNEASMQQSSESTVSGIYFATIGNHTINLTISSNDCDTTISYSFEVAAKPNFKSIYIISNRECSSSGYSYNFSTIGNTLSEYTYQWTLSENASIQQSVENRLENVSFSSIGKQYISLTISSRGCDTTITYLLDVMAKPSFKNIVVQFERQWSSSSYTYNFSTTGNTLTQYAYQWNFGSDASTQYSSENRVSGITFSTIGSHTLYLTVSSNECDTTISYPFEVISKPTYSTISISASRSCSAAGYAYNFSTSGNSLSEFTYQWNFGTTASIQYSTENNPSNILFSSSGNKTIELTISSNGSDTIITYAVDVIAKPNFKNIGISSSNNCENYSFTTSGNTLSQYSYQWNFGTDASLQSSSENSPKDIIFSNAGGHTIYLTITSNDCDTTISHSFNVSAKPKFKDITISSSRSCGTSTYSYSFLTAGNSLSQYTYKWDFGSDASSQYSTASAPAEIEFYTTGNHLIYLTINSSDCDTTISYALDVISKPDFESITIAATHSCSSSSNSYDFSTNGNALSQYDYQWNFGNGATPQYSSDNAPSGIKFSCSGSATIYLKISAGDCDTTITYLLDASKLSEISNYAIIASESIDMQKESEVEGGALGVTSNAGTITVHKDVMIEGINSWSAAYKIVLNPQATVSDVYVDRIVSNGNIKGSIHSFPYPLLQLPSFPTVYPGTKNVKVSGTVTLQPGSYNDITIQSNSTLILQDGVYQISNLITSSKASIKYSSGSIVLIKDKLSIAKSNKIYPKSDNEKLLILYVERGTYASVQDDGEVEAIIVIPNGKIEIFKEAEIEGVLVGKQVYLQQGAKVEYKNASCWASTLSAVNTNMQLKNEEGATSSATDSTNSNLTTIEDIVAVQFSITYYPNPTSSVLNIKCMLPENSTNASIEIFDIHGSQVKSITIEQSSSLHTVDVTTYKSGIYFLQVKTDATLLARERFIIAK